MNSRKEYIDAIKKDINVYKNVPEQIRYNKELVLEIIESLNSDHPAFINMLSKKLKIDEDIWLKLVEKDPLLLKYAHRKFKANKTVVIAAIKNFKLVNYKDVQKESNELLSIIEESLRTDEDVAIESDKICYLAQWYFPTIDIELAILKKEYESELPINKNLVKKVKI